MKTIAALALATAHPLLIAAEPDVIGTDEAPAFLKVLNTAETRAIGSFGMDFKNSAGGIDDFTFEAGSFLGKPVDLAAGYSLLTYFNYETHLIRPEGVLPGIPLGDEELHEIDLSMFLYKISPDTPWITGAWINPSLATDFQSVSGDDFFLDVAGFAGYRFTDRFILGAGLGALNVTGDTSIFPGLGMMWSPTDELFVTLYGANFLVTWVVDDEWWLGFDVRPNGGIWNIDSAAGSRNIDFTSFRVGATSSHRLTDQLWFTVGGGITTGNTLNITNTEGSSLFQNQLDDLDTGVYGFLSLALKTW